MSDHPYNQQPDYAFWRRSFESVEPSKVDPVIKAPFAIVPEDRVVTAGSCFAQHIARHLRRHGLNYHVTEQAHPIVPRPIAEKNHYGQFSARYGNIYTTAQLLQLFKRAYGTWESRESAWRGENGEALDPFRPQIQPGGYINEDEMLADRRQHLVCVRRAFEELDVFVFTLGLTEHWRSNQDGSVFPLCPGTAGGAFDPGRYEFVNANVNQIVSELGEFIDLLRSVNSKSKIILTVSPVPLVATAEDRHVLVSTTYSKSVLRVAAEMVVRSRSDVAYFPSYEIITGTFNRGQYFAEDLRSVLEIGVQHVMRLFLKHYANLNAENMSAVVAGGGEPKRAVQVEKRPDRAHIREERIARRRQELQEARRTERRRMRVAGIRQGSGAARPDRDAHDAFYQDMERLVEVDCDEEVLDRK